MKYVIISSLLLVVCSVATFGQGGLKGRVYYSGDIIAEKLDAAVKEIEQNRPQLRAEAICKLEEKKGRKLNAAEMGSIDSELDEKLEKAKLKRASTSMSLTITFTRDNELAMKPNEKIDDEESVTGFYYLPQCHCSKCGHLSSYEKTVCPHCRSKMDLNKSQ